MTNAAIAALMLLAAEQDIPPQRPSDPVETTSGANDRQQTTITRSDNSNSGNIAGGRILSRRETRLNTRITKDKIVTIGRASGASRKPDRPEPQDR